MQKLRKFPILFIMSIIFFVISLVVADTILFTMEGKLPVIQSTVEGNGAGVQKVSLETRIIHLGKASVRWDYQLPVNPQGNYPTIELSIPVENQNWKGKMKLGVWIYLDSSVPKTFWTIQPVISNLDSGKTIELGNWNVGEKGIPPRTWIYHEWSLPQNEGLTKVSHLRFYYHAGDGWKDVATNGKVSICLDDINLVALPESKSENILMKIPRTKFELEYVRNEKTGKMYFTLNKQPYLPIIYSAHFHQISQEFLDSIKERNCNGIEVVIDATDAGKDELKQVLELCATNNIPVIMEINEWEYWGYLKTHPELNMGMLNGNIVKYFPDYANPVAKAEHLARFKKAAQWLKYYAHDPVIAISVGAYDAYHLPDGEVHVDFTIPKHPQRFGTYVPYGSSVQKGFADYLKSPENQINLPDTPESAGSKELWKKWILFRRALVKSWLKETLETVRRESGLPSTVTFDINFSLQERFATPPFDWTEIMDFVIVYYYGRVAPADYIPALLRTFYKEFNDAEKPIMTLLEFSSAGKRTSGEEYAIQSAPFVSGFITTGPDPNRSDHNTQRVNSYLNWVYLNRNKLMDIHPEKADILILVDKEAIYYENPFSSQLNNLKIPYDIQYLSSNDEKIEIHGYKDILVDLNFPKGLLAKIKTEGQVVKQKPDENALAGINIKEPQVFSIMDWKTGNLLMEDTFDEKELSQWENYLKNGSWKLKNNRLFLLKSNQNVKGLASKLTFNPPYMIEAILSFGSTGHPRLSLLDDAGYPLNSVGKEAMGEANELSIGVDPINPPQGELGFFLDEWNHIGYLSLYQDYLLRVYLIPETKEKDIAYFTLNSLHEGKTPLIHSLSHISKRKKDRLWLLWAWDDAEMEIDSIKIYQLIKQ